VGRRADRHVEQVLARLERVDGDGRTPDALDDREMARLVSASAMVSGTVRLLVKRTMTNWPGRRFLAMCGASTQKRTTSGPGSLAENQVHEYLTATGNAEMRKHGDGVEPGRIQARTVPGRPRRRRSETH